MDRNDVRCGCGTILRVLRVAYFFYASLNQYQYLVYSIYSINNKLSLCLCPTICPSSSSSIDIDIIVIVVIGNRKLAMQARAKVQSMKKSSVLFVALLNQTFNVLSSEIIITESLILFLSEYSDRTQACACIHDSCVLRFCVLLHIHIHRSLTCTFNRLRLLPCNAPQRQRHRCCRAAHDGSREQRRQRIRERVRRARLRLRLPAPITSTAAVTATATLA